MEWISVKDRLPEIGVEVLIYEPGCLIQINFRDDDDYWDCDGVVSRITHWMPLPKPPKENET